MTEVREMICDRVHANPGVHFNALVRQLGFASGQVQYHLRQLLSDGSVVSESIYGRTHYYPPEYDLWERRTLALLHRETAADIVAYLLTNGSSSTTVVADDLEIARSTLEWHVDRLVEQDVVSKRRDGGNRITLTVDERGRIIEVLQETDPSLRERFVDRFTRLVDQLLEQ